MIHRSLRDLPAHASITLGSLRQLICSILRYRYPYLYRIGNSYFIQLYLRVIIFYFFKSSSRFNTSRLTDDPSIPYSFPITEQGANDQLSEPLVFLPHLILIISSIYFSGIFKSFYLIYRFWYVLICDLPILYINFNTIKAYKTGIKNHLKLL